LDHLGVKEGQRNPFSAADGTSGDDSGSSDGDRGSRTAARKKKSSKQRHEREKGARDETLQQQQLSEGKMREAIHRKSSLLNVVKQKYEQVQCIRLSVDESCISECCHAVMRTLLSPSDSAVHRSAGRRNKGRRRSDC
jgi:hypothetical protein